MTDSNKFNLVASKAFQERANHSTVPSMVEAYNPNDLISEEPAPSGGGMPLADPIPRALGRVLQFPTIVSRRTNKPGADVERTNQFEFYEMGRAFQAMRAYYYMGEVHPTIIFNDLVELGRILYALLNQGEPTPLGLSRVRAQSLYDCVDGFITRHYSELNDQGQRQWRYAKEDAPTIQGHEIVALRDAISTFETVFGEEMREAATYRVPSRGIYSIPKLVDSADESFPEELIIQIPDKARVEWRAAGRCLAFNLLAASGFHVARAVEAMLEAYYQECCGKEDEKKTWGDYLSALTKAREKDEASVSQRVIDELTQMKDDYRNPIMHPRVVLSETDARMLFDNGESLIMVMAQELQKRDDDQARAELVNAFAPKKTKGALGGKDA